MVVKDSDIILIERDDVLYKTTVAGLSSYCLTKHDVADLIDQLNQLEADIYAVSASFKETHYTTETIKETFETQAKANAVLENENYVSEDEVKDELALRVSIADVDSSVTNEQSDAETKMGEIKGLIKDSMIAMAEG